ALQGAGAVSAAVTAMLSDSVRPRAITQAMSFIGSSIGLTFAFSLVASPLIASAIGVPGLFWITAALSAAAIFVILRVVPEPPAKTPEQLADHRPWPQVVFDGQLLLLNAGIFALHFMQMALFVAVPQALVAAGLPAASHWAVYLPAVAASFAVMFPAVRFADRRGAAKALFTGAVALVGAVFALLPAAAGSAWTVAPLLLAFFTGFNVLEVLLPSLVTQAAPAADKGLALGVYNTTQSLGLFAGGFAGGALYDAAGGDGVYLACLAVALAWLAATTLMRVRRRREPGSEVDFGEGYGDPGGRR
ncbi:MAG: MFS transporter, partial [Duodenibacillus sp.]|nr:MFS transporter [Duodenibacillus sp.]